MASLAEAEAQDGQWEQSSEHYGEAPSVEMPETTPRVLLFGNSRAGKTSILNVVFQKMAPHETLFVQPTQSLDIKFVANNAFVQFQIWDFPGYFDLEHDTLMYGDEQLTNEMVLGQEQTAIIFVIDAQDEPYQEALQYLVHTFHTACRYNPNINFEVFIHKVDGDLFLTDEQKYECLQEIQESIADLGEGKLDDVTVSHHLTSNHDHSIYEAVSKVVQKLMPQLSALEKLLNTLISNCDMEKSFLFDVVSKIYIASDSNPVRCVSASAWFSSQRLVGVCLSRHACRAACPVMAWPEQNSTCQVDIHIYELCSDMIDVVIDVSCIYGVRRRRTRKDENVSYGVAHLGVHCYPHVVCAFVSGR